MKIFFFGSDYTPTGGGIATYTREWLEALSYEQNVEGKVRIFGNKNPRTEKIGERLILTTVKSVNFFYVGYKVFLDMLKHRDYDLFHAFNLFPVGFWVIFWSKIFCKKSILVFYGADACDKRTSRKVLVLQKWAITHATKAITISEFTKTRVMNRYKISGDTIQVIHPVLPRLEKNTSTENIRAQYGIAQDDFVVVSMSRLVKRKGLEYVIEAISKIPDEKVKLLIVSDGKERAPLEVLSKKLSLDSCIIFAGKVPTLAPYYLSSDVAVLASYVIEEEGDFEGLGLVLLEAQSYGLPVIGTQSGGIPETFVEGKTGLLVSERNAQALADAILKLKTDRDLYEKMKQNAPAFLEQEFGNKATIQKYLKLVDMI